jgi:hypothetical protein
VNVIDSWPSCFLLLIIFDAVPDALDGVLVIQLIEYAIAPNHYEVMLLRQYLEGLYLWSGYNDIRVSSVSS